MLRVTDVENIDRTRRFEVAEIANEFTELQYSSASRVLLKSFVFLWR
jgi:hypothetical protein